MKKFLFEKNYYVVTLLVGLFLLSLILVLAFNTYFPPSFCHIFQSFCFCVPLAATVFIWLCGLCTLLVNYVEVIFNFF